MSLFDRLLEQQLKPAPKPALDLPKMVEHANRELAPALGSTPRSSAPSPRSFEARRARWREEALAKVPRPPPPTPSVLDRQPLPEPPPPSPRPTPTPPAPVNLAGPLVARGSCKAINPETGRQCALLSGHTKLHRHGSTEFRYGAQPGQRFARRDALDRLASSRNHPTPATGE